MEWLDREITSVASRRFFLYDDPLCGENRKQAESSSLPVPPSYQEFVLKYGNAQFYRKGGRYLVRVFAVPEDAEVEGKRLLCFGRMDETLAYFAVDSLAPGKECDVFEWSHHQGLRPAYAGFESWLIAKSQSARARFNAKEWRAIQKGPAPFTAAEIRIVTARRKFKWRVMGLADDGDILIEVSNGSEIVLPFLTIGVRSDSPRFVGGVWLPVADVAPGETRVIKRSIYKETARASDLELFEVEDPIPEDRERYWEFGSMPRR